MVYDQKERRQHPRVSIAVSVRIEYTSFKFQATTENLSIGGMLLFTERRLPIGTKVKLELQAPMKSMLLVRAEGMVVRIKDSEPRGLAICFTDLSEKERENLMTLVEKLDQPVGQVNR
jgi:c-di-GMP-binding flagellar brake protein YcgR